MNKTNFTLMVSAFSKAATYIQQGRTQQASQLVTSLSEPVYETALSYCYSKKKNRYYWLTRYVLHAIDMQSRYCVTDPKKCYDRRTHNREYEKGQAKLERYLKAYLAAKPIKVLNLNHGQVAIVNQVFMFAS